jgi:hypothetical protein
VPDHEHRAPRLAVDLVILTVRDNTLQVLVIEPPGGSA